MKYYSDLIFGVIFIVISCVVLYVNLPLTFMLLRGLIVSGYPISTYSSPVITYSIAGLFILVVAAWVIIFGRGIYTAVKDSSNKEMLVFVLGVSVISVTLLLRGIHHLCVEEYDLYVNYRIAAGSSIHEKQLELVRDLMKEMGIDHCIKGSLFTVTGLLLWKVAGKFLKMARIPGNDTG